MRFLPENRVRLQRDFDFIKSNGIKADCSAFILYIAPARENRDCCRLGVVASKRVGNSVVRHHAKRIFREIFRTSDLAGKNCDILVFVRRGYSKFKFENLKRKFDSALSGFGSAK